MILQHTYGSVGQQELNCMEETYPLGLFLAHSLVIFFKLYVGRNLGT